MKYFPSWQNREGKEGEYGYRDGRRRYGVFTGEGFGPTQSGLAIQDPGIRGQDRAIHICRSRRNCLKDINTVADMRLGAEGVAPQKDEGGSHAQQREPSGVSVDVVDHGFNPCAVLARVPDLHNRTRNHSQYNLFVEFRIDSYQVTRIYNEFTRSQPPRIVWNASRLNSLGP